MILSGIEPEVGSALINLAGTLSKLALKGTATAIHGRIEALKTEKNADTIRNSYNEIVNQLLEEREEAVRIAQTYKQELDKVIISDDDIEYLQQTITKVLNVIQSLQLTDTTNNDPEHKIKTQTGIKAMESFNNLISKDVLKTMQLLGFNYKAAIGEPLTELCASAIRSLGNHSTTLKNPKRK